MEARKAHVSARWLVVGGLAALTTAATACGGSSSSSSASSAAAGAGSSASSAASSAASGASSAASGASSAASSAASNGKKYVVGVSNTLAGQRLARGDDLLDQGAGEGLGPGLEADRRQPDRAAPQQIADIRNLISAGANVDHRQPVEPGGARCRDQAGDGEGDHRRRGRPGRSTSRAPTTCTNDQVPVRQARRRVALQEAQRQRQRGRDARRRRRPADTDRHNGFKDALKAYPNIKVVKSVFTGWALATGGEADPGHPQLRHEGRRRLDIRHRLERRRRVQDRRQAATCRSSAPTTTGSSSS